MSKVQKEVIQQLANALEDGFNERQKRPDQYVVAYYNNKDEFLGYHADTFCNLTQVKEKGKRYAGDNPFAQLAIIRKNLDSTIDTVEVRSGLETGLGAMLDEMNMVVRNKHFKDLKKEDIYIQAEYLEDGIPPQRFVYKVIEPDGEADVNVNESE